MEDTHEGRIVCSTLAVNIVLILIVMEDTHEESRRISP